MVETGGHCCVYGLSWGDEGKGKIVDLLCSTFDIVVRYNGGANAGHTVCVGSKRYALHLLPTGLLHEHVQAVIGPGVVVDPIKLIEELDGLREGGLDVERRLRISERSHLVLAYHKLEDQLSERAANLGSGTKIGTTARGIGPAYADKMRRTTAVRFVDFVKDDDNLTRIRTKVQARRDLLHAQYGSDGSFDVDQLIKELIAVRHRIKPLICDTTTFLHEAMTAGQSVLFEGANGILLDIDHGTYPFVTSSSTGPHGVGPGAGVPPHLISRRIGIAKAYATRVGSGPFVSELKGEVGDSIRERGHEYGTTTGRPRRCGWFDAVSCRYGAQVGGASDVALLHLDTLSGFDEVGICIAYRLHGETIETFSACVDDLDAAQPVFEMMPGWQEDLRCIRKFEDLPANTLAYIAKLESLIGVPISLIGVGPDRSQTIVRGRLAKIIKVPEPSSV